MHQSEINELKRELERKKDSHQKLSSALTDLKKANDQLQVKEHKWFAFLKKKAHPSFSS